MMRPLTVLVVEDDWLIAEDLKGTLEELGCKVLGPAASCAAAIDIIQRERADLAYVDTQLGSETCEPVLKECDRRRIKVVISTGHFANELPAYAVGFPILSKPFARAHVEASLQGYDAVDGD